MMAMRIYVILFCASNHNQFPEALVGNVNQSFLPSCTKAPTGFRLATFQMICCDYCLSSTIAFAKPLGLPFSARTHFVFHTLNDDELIEPLAR